MARARNIKPAIMANEDLADLEPIARLLFIYLWMLADREGRMEDRPRRIKAEALPYDDCDIENLLGQLTKGEFIERYEVDGVSVIQIMNFTKHQNPHHKEVSSKLPPNVGEPKITRHGYDVPARMRDYIFNRDGNKCLKCSTDTSLTIDHIVPLSKGGDNSKTNLQTLCHSCNSGKGDATVSYVDSINVPEEKRSNYRSHSGTNQGQPKHESSMGQACAKDDSCGSHVAPLIPDTGSLIPDCGYKHTDASAPECDNDESLFDQAWAAYPKRAGGNPKLKARQAWAARMKEGVDPDDMLGGVYRYAKFCQAENIEKTRYVLQASTFFGPALRFQDDYSPPEKPGKPKTNADRNADWNARLAQMISGTLDAPKHKEIDMGVIHATH